MAELCRSDAATGARAFVAFKEERCFGIEDDAVEQAKSADGNWKKIPITSESVIRDATTLESAALNPERARRTRVQGSSSVGGDVNSELSNDGFIWLISQAIGRVVMPPKFLSSDASDSATDTSDATVWEPYDFTLSDHGSAHPGAPITVLPVESNGLTLSQNAVFLQTDPSDIAASSRTSDGTVYDSANGIHYDTVNSSDFGFKNGFYTVPAFGLEPGMTWLIGRDPGLIQSDDGSAVVAPTDNIYFQYEGMKVNTWTFTASPTEIVTSTFSLLGRAEVLKDRATPTNIIGQSDPFTGFSGAGIIDAKEICILSFDMTVNNNFGTDQFCLGERFRNSLPDGQRQIEGTFTTEFRDTLLYNKFVSGTAVKIEIILDLLEDGLGSKTDIGSESMRLILPNVEFNGTTPQNSGNEVINMEVPYVALWLDAANSELIRESENLAPSGFDIALEFSTASLRNRSTVKWV